MIALALLAASLLAPIADVREVPLPPPRPVVAGPDLTGEAIRITALAASRRSAATPGSTG